MKINYNTFSHLMGYKEPHRLMKITCFFNYDKCTLHNGGVVTATMHWWSYLLLVVPVHIVKFFGCLWDGGLKNFEIEGRKLVRRYIDPTSDGIKWCEEHKIF